MTFELHKLSSDRFTWVLKAQNKIVRERLKIAIKNKWCPFWCTKKKKNIRHQRENYYIPYCKKNIFKICHHNIFQICQINLNNLFSSDNLLFWVSISFIVLTKFFQFNQLKILLHFFKLNQQYFLQCTVKKNVTLFFTFLKAVSAFQGCIYLIKLTVKAVIVNYFSFFLIYILKCHFFQNCIFITSLQCHMILQKSFQNEIISNVETMIVW